MLQSTENSNVAFVQTNTLIALGIVSAAVVLVDYRCELDIREPGHENLHNGSLVISDGKPINGGLLEFDESLKGLYVNLVSGEIIPNNPLPESRR